MRSSGCSRSSGSSSRSGGPSARCARYSTSSRTGRCRSIDADEIVYFRDVYDHVIRLTDELDNYRELAAATLDVYLTQVNNNLSAIMKRLAPGSRSSWRASVRLAGIFGMSEAGTALAGTELPGFWVVTGGDDPRRRRASAVVLRRIGWILGESGPNRPSDEAFGWASAGSAGQIVSIGIAMTWVLPKVALGPFGRLQPHLLARRR